MAKIDTAAVVRAATYLEEELFTIAHLIERGVSRAAVIKAIEEKLLVVARKGTQVLTHKTGQRGRPAILYRLSAKGKKVAG